MPARTFESGLPVDCKMRILFPMNLFVFTPDISVLTFVARMSHNKQKNGDAAGRLDIESSTSAVILAGHLV